MNLEEIEKKFFEIVTQYCDKCCEQIDGYLVRNYRQIKHTGKVEIKVDYCLDPTMFNRSAWYFVELVEAIKKHYSENWEVEYRQGNEYMYSCFIFQYKNKDGFYHLTKTPETENVSRSELMDLRNE